MPVSVTFSAMLAAAHMPPRGDAIPAVVHRLTGGVLFISATDPTAAELFPGLALDEVQEAVSLSPDWLAVPKHTGQPMELKGFVERWCEASGFMLTSNEPEPDPRTR